MKYVKSKFARALLDVLKVTQDNDRGAWKLIPIQNFTVSSDIDWSKPIHEIDLQLYRNFIYPKVVGGSVGLPSIWVLVAVIIGGSLFGIMSTH